MQYSPISNLQILFVLLFIALFKIIFWFFGLVDLVDRKMGIEMTEFVMKFCNLNEKVVENIVEAAEQHGVN